MKALCWLLWLLAPAVAATPAGDPMAPPPALQQGSQAAGDEVAELRLQQVVQGGTPRAAINGRWLRLGEQIGPWQVRRIEARTVLLDDGARTLRLTLFERGQVATRGD